MGGLTRARARRALRGELAGRLGAAAAFWAVTAATLAGHGATGDGVVALASPVNIFLFILGTILSQIALRLLRKNLNDSQFRDEKPTTLATRGTYCDWVSGRRRVGPVFAWAGNRTTTTEDGQTVYWEDGVHVLCVGPITAIHQILSDGKLIHDFGPGGLRSVVPGFGTRAAPQTFTDSEGGSLTVYFGWDDQPIDADAPGWIGGAAGSVNSRFPSVCWIKWNKKRLGFAAFWPQVDYEVSRIPEAPYTPGSYLSGSPAFLRSTLAIEPGAGPFPIVGATDWSLSVPPVRATVTVTGDATEWAIDGAVLRVSGNAVNGDFTIAFSVYSSGPDETTITLAYEEEVVGMDATGVVEFYELGDDGVNAAHAIASLLFDPWPWGAGRPLDEFDLDSLEELASLFESEHLATNVRVSEGESVQGALGLLMQDAGVMLAHTPDGALRFVPVREPVTVKSIPEELVIDPVPEIATVHGPKPATTDAFTFTDRNSNYRLMPIYVDDDGQAGREGSQRSDATQLPTVTSYRVASRVAERRALEDEVQVGSGITLTLARGARDLYPGQPVAVEGIPFRLRVDTVQPRTDSGKVTVIAVRDTYGVPESTYEGEPPGALALSGGGGGGISGHPGAWWETPIPGGLTGLGPWQPRGRLHEWSAELLVFAARERSTTTQYVVWAAENGGDDVPRARGRYFSVIGELAVGLAAEDPVDVGVDDEGAVVSVSGPDVADLPILSTDEDAWRRGELCLLVGDELCFASRVVGSPDGTAVVRGLIRARWGTALAAHDAGAAVVLFEPERVVRVFVAPGATVEVRLQYAGGRDSMAVDDAPAVSGAVSGRSVLPGAPVEVNVLTGDLSYRPGQGFMLWWGYTSTALPATGAGEAPAGDRVGQSRPIDTFVVELLDSAGAVAWAREVSEGSCYVRPADLLLAYGAEPASLTARVTALRGAYKSESVEVVIQKV